MGIVSKFVAMFLRVILLSCLEMVLSSSSSVRGTRSVARLMLDDLGACFHGLVMI